MTSQACLLAKLVLHKIAHVSICSLPQPAMTQKMPLLSALPCVLAPHQSALAVIPLAPTWPSPLAPGDPFSEVGLGSTP